MIKPRMQTPTESYVTYYPQFVELADTQLEKCLWFASEIDVEKDRQDLMINMTAAEKHAVSVALKLFVKYELFVGSEHWNGRIRKMFPIPEIQRMASVFGMVEEAVHAPFYDKLNQVLGNNVDEFYTSYAEDPVLAQRMAHLGALVDSDDDLVSLAVFSLIEGAVLFSSFALFKSFQSNGKNLIGNTVRGINQSIIDEGLHQTAGAVLFKTLLSELDLSKEQLADLHSKIIEAALVLGGHEEDIIDMFTEKGEIGISAYQFKEFVHSRLNICLSDLDISPAYVINDDSVAKWFYDGVQKFQSIDFFTSGIGREYTRGWSAEKFVWKKETK